MDVLRGLSGTLAVTMVSTGWSLKKLVLANVSRKWNFHFSTAGRPSPQNSSLRSVRSGGHPGAYPVSLLFAGRQ